MGIFTEYVSAARERHITFSDENMLGFQPFTCDIDVYVGIWDKKIPAGTYYIKSGEYNYEVGKTASAPIVFKLAVDRGAPGTEPDEVTAADGTTVKAERAGLNLVMEPIEISKGVGLTYPEFVAWLAIDLAPSNEVRDEILRSLYNIEVKAPDEPKQSGRKATKRYDPVTKLHQNMSNPQLYEEFGVSLDVAGRAEAKRGKKVETLVALEYVAEDGEMVLTRHLSEFDIQVYNAVASLYEAGKSEITLQEIYEMTIGKGKAKQQQLERISDSVETLRRTKLKADVTQEVKAHGLVDPETGEPWEQMKIDDFLFSALRVTMRSVNGRSTAGYQFNVMPIGLRYAKASGQIVSYPVKYLDTKSAGSNTERNVVIRGYLAQRIEQARGGKMSKTIRCDKIYDKAGINKENRMERKRVNKYIKGVLDVWREQGFFKDYELVAEGQRQMDKIMIKF